MDCPPISLEVHERGMRSRRRKLEEQRERKAEVEIEGGGRSGREK